MMIGNDIYNRIRINQNIRPEDKPLIYKLFDISNQISFGKIDSRREGYKFSGKGYTRCTSITQMDGARAAALTEWAKREIVSFAKENLVCELNKVGYLNQESINFIMDGAFEYPDKQRDFAAWQGTKAHDNVENWLNTKSFVEDSNLEIFRRIWFKEGVELIATEIPLVWHNKSYGFGGKLDILAYLDGDFIIYDNKTSRSIHEGYALQVAAYKNAVEQMSPGLKIKKCKIIHLANTKEMKEWQLKQYNKLGSLIEVKHLDKAWSNFKRLLELYENRNQKYF